MPLVNGAPSEFVPASDRGFSYGDGVFRTLRARKGEPLHWALHYAKLREDCTALNIPCPESVLLLREVRAATAAESDAAVRITITRGSGTRGYLPPTSCAPLRVISATRYTPRAVPPGGAALHLCRLRLAHQPALAGIKHLNRLENVLARAEWNDPQIHEGLLLDQDANVIGGTMSNVFVREEDALLTPLLTRCGVAGVTRTRVMALAAKLGITCRTDHLPLERVLSAHEIFVVNSLIGAWPVARLGGRVWPTASLAAQIATTLRAQDATLD